MNTGREMDKNSATGGQVVTRRVLSVPSWFVLSVLMGKPEKQKPGDKFGRPLVKQ